MKRKLISLTLVLAMALTLLPVSALAAAGDPVAAAYKSGEVKEVTPTGATPAKAATYVSTEFTVASTTNGEANTLTVTIANKPYDVANTITDVTGQQDAWLAAFNKDSKSLFSI